MNPCYAWQWRTTVNSLPSQRAHTQLNRKRKSASPAEAMPYPSSHPTSISVLCSLGARGKLVKRASFVTAPKILATADSRLWWETPHTLDKRAYSRGAGLPPESYTSKGETIYHHEHDAQRVLLCQPRVADSHLFEHPRANATTHVANGSAESD